MSKKKKLELSVLRPGTLGDIICTIPLIYGLSVRYETTVTLITEDNTPDDLALDLVTLYPFIEKILFYKSQESKTKTLVSLTQVLHREKANLLFVVPKLNESRFSLRRISLLLVGRALRMKVVYPSQKLENRFSDGNYYNEYTRMELLFPGIPANLNGSELIRKHAHNKAGNTSSERIIVIVYGAKFLSKNWSIENYLSLIKKITNSASNRVELFCLSKDTDLIARFKDFKEKNFSLYVQKSLPFLVSRISRCDAFIGMDTGTTHLASLYNSNIFVITSDRDRQNWAPLQYKKIFRRFLSCGGCNLSLCDVPKHPCMNLIEPEEVHHAIGS